ncbi:MAG: choice-of-anchor Q domain-containing protein, partial [Actinomycetota bacterium]
MNDGSATAFVLDNTIVANNGANECIVSGVVATSSGAVSSGGNLITANDGCPGVVETADPQLGPLQPNAPGDTPTMAIQYGISPAVDAGDDATALATDQRGVPRPQGAHSDIGAYEAPPPSADLSLTKEVSSSTAQPGDRVTYTLTVKNSGPNTANTVTVTDDLPSELTFVSCSASGGGSCSYSGSGITATYGSLAVDETETVAVQTTLNAGTQDNVTVVNTASVSASSPTDPDTSNNSSSASFTVHNRADLAVTKQVSATQVEVGDPVTYT